MLDMWALGKDMRGVWVSQFAGFRRAAVKEIQRKREERKERACMVWWRYGSDLIGWRS